MLFPPPLTVPSLCCMSHISLLAKYFVHLKVHLYTSFSVSTDNLNNALGAIRVLGIELIEDELKPHLNTVLTNIRERSKLVCSSGVIHLRTAYVGAWSWFIVYVCYLNVMWHVMCRCFYCHVCLSFSCQLNSMLTTCRAVCLITSNLNNQPVVKPHN